MKTYWNIQYTRMYFLVDLQATIIRKHRVRFSQQSREPRMSGVYNAIREMEYYAQTE